VVKGLCGGASGLLLGLKVQLEQNGHSACTSEALDEVRAAAPEPVRAALLLSPAAARAWVK
jgi:hypothetical protein